MTAIQSMLFVPGNKPERFAKALASGADCVCIDLEDAVPADGKDAARAAAIAAIPSDDRLAIRINGLRTKAGLADLLALADAGARPSLIYLPMCDAPAEVDIVSKILGDDGVGFVPLLETVASIKAAGALAAHPATAALMLGGADLSSQLGGKMGWDTLMVPRGEIVMAAAGAGKWAIDVPFIDINDEAGLIAEATRVKAMGFTCKSAIHPNQIAAIHQVYRPTGEEIEEAEAAIAAWAAANGAAVQFRGKMLDAPFMARYHKIMEYKDLMNA
jgi:(S)-citramalyl-CoA lyase